VALTGVAACLNEPHKHVRRMQLLEFSTNDQLVIAVRTLIAALLGALIGIERWKSGKEAGMRTHALVAAAAALAVGLGEMVLSNAGGIAGDSTRVLHAVITGIGFIGAGAILHGEKRTSGLTTAASVFNVAIIGACAGMGALLLAVLGAVASLTVLQLFGRVRSKFMGKGGGDDGIDD
jgi:putative Mg2+ transporter-C (MgtC) family protein